MEYEVSKEILFHIESKPDPYDNKSRKKAYREVLAGLRYHTGEKLSFVTIGFKRGSVIDVRTFLKKLTTWIKRLFDKRIAYYRVTVWDNNSPDGDWRVHIHMIWNAPYIKQSLILEKVSDYIGESGSVFIKLLDENDKKTARYLMQYLGNQDGCVKFYKSRNWLPNGYTAEWNALRREFFEHVTTGYRPCNKVGVAEVDRLIVQNTPEWIQAGLIENMNAWIDEQRDTPQTNQYRLYNPLDLRPPVADYRDIRRLYG
jgi:hypothetical protein